MASQSRKHRGGNRLGSPKERLFARTVYVPETGCHEYAGGRTRAGYGYLTIESKQMYAHRLMVQIIEDRMLRPDEVVMHLCDNPPCVNYEHLRVGTVAENNRDMWGKGRGKLTPPAWRKIPLDEVPEIVARYRLGESKVAIAEDYGVTRQAIHYLLRREGAA